MSLAELEEGGGYDNEDKEDDDDNDDYDDDNDDDNDEDDVMDMLLRTHYEATHDVVGRVRIHRFVNPECYSHGPDGEEYLMAKALVLDVVETDRTRMRKHLEDGNKRRGSSTGPPSPPTATTTAAALSKLEGQRRK
jgi:hypothetical protein